MSKYKRGRMLCNLVSGVNEKDNVINSEARLPSTCKEYEEISTVSQEPVSNNVDETVNFVEMRNVTPTINNNYSLLNPVESVELLDFPGMDVELENNNYFINTETSINKNVPKEMTVELSEVLNVRCENRFADKEISQLIPDLANNTTNTDGSKSNDQSEANNCLPPAKKKKRVTDLETKLKLRKEKHPMLPACNDKCIRKCKSNITEEQRKDIWHTYWDMDVQRKRDFISRNVESNKIAIRYSTTTKRNHTHIYKLSDHRVCKTMFLRTLGYKNDQAVTAVLKSNFMAGASKDSTKVSAALDLRGRHKPKHAFSEEYNEEIDNFIELFHPTTSHYNLQHAPNRRYLPSGLTFTQMFSFLKAHLERKGLTPCSWSSFHKRIQLKNISTQQPMQDKCPKYEAHDVAHPKPRLPRDENAIDHSCHECDCQFCDQYLQHKSNKNISRAHMNADKEESEKPNSGIALYTVDMQKCITMPQLRNKDFFFSRKLNLFNETFASVGKGNKPATAMLWHEGESGRKAFDVATAYVLFIKKKCRDVNKIILYADNCNAQNKNKILYSALIRLVNDINEIQVIKMEYLEPGHTYMSADSVHAAITNKMNKAGDLYDIDDYVHVINNSRKNLTTHLHDHRDVLIFKNELKTTFPKNFNISNFKIVEFRRGQTTLFVKTKYEDSEFKKLDIFSKKLKGEILKAVGKEIDMFKNIPKKTEPDGISQIKKDDLIKLLKFMPNSRRKFFENLRVNEAITEDLDKSASEMFDT